MTVSEIEADGENIVIVVEKKPEEDEQEHMNRVRIGIEAMTAYEKDKSKHKGIAKSTRTNK